MLLIASSDFTKIAEEESADIISDNLLQFSTSEPAEESPYLEGFARGWITLNRTLGEARLFGTGRDFGYLKPIFRANRLKSFRLEYDERLRIAEDDDLILRALAAGLRYFYEPSQTYLYRRHSSSTSHRLSISNAAAMCAASAEAIERYHAMPVGRLLKERHRALVRGLAFVRLVDAIKGKRWLECMRIAIAHPNAVPLLRMPVAAALSRKREPPSPHASGSEPLAAGKQDSRAPL